MSPIIEKIQKRSLALNKALEWEKVLPLLNKYKDQIEWMEDTKGDPCVILHNDNFYLVDSSKESPNRRSLCYDKDARIKRKKFPPKSSALEECEEHGVQLMDESLYRHLQTFGEFDLKTSSWVLTPNDIRKKGGSLFCDRRYDTVFVYHNGADSYYEARGFRSYIKLS